MKALQRTVEKQADELDECREQVAILRGIIGQMQTTYTPEYFRQLTDMAVHGYMRGQQVDRSHQRPPRQIPPSSGE